MEFAAMDRVLSAARPMEDEQIAQMVKLLQKETKQIIDLVGDTLGFQKGMTPGTVATGIIACRLAERMLVGSLNRTDRELVRMLDGMTDLLEGELKVMSAVIPRPRQM